MSTLIASASRWFLFAGIAAFLLIASGTAFAAGPSKTLQDVAVWDVHGLSSGNLANITADKNRFSGKLQVKDIPNELFPEVIGFKSESQQQYNIALIFPGKCLISLLPTLKETALADVEMSQLVVLLTPPANAGATIQLPAQVGAVKMPFVGGTTIKLDAGATFFSHANLGGQTAALLHAVGTPSRDIIMSGKIDARIFSGAGLKNPQLQNELVSMTDLTFSLTALVPERKPSYLTFGDSTLAMKGSKSGKVALSIATSLVVNVGSGVRFDKITIHRDPVKRLVTITGSSAASAGFITIPVADAAIKELTFHGLIDEQVKANDTFTLEGKYVVGGSSPRSFTATLSGGVPAQYVVTVQADTTLGKMLGWSAPGLDALVIKDVSAGNGYTSGNLSLKGIDFTVVVFKAVGQKNYNAAFLSKATFKLPTLMSSLQNTPLADLELAHPGFVLVPPENAGKGIKLPDPISRHFGLSVLDFRQGLNLIAQANTSGALADLLKSAGLSTAKLPITGTLDSAILAGTDSPLSDSFINATSLRISLPAAVPDRKPSYLDFGDSTFMMAGVSGKIASGILTSLKVNVGNGVRFDKVTINRDPVKRLVTITSGRITPGTPVVTLPIENAAISDLAFHGLIDEQNKANDSFTLDGAYSLQANKPEKFTATLSGGSPAQYLVTLQTDTTLGKLMKWSAPGVDSLMLTEVSFGNGFIQGKLTLKGMNFAAVLFKGSGQTKYNIAFLSTEVFRLTKLKAALQGTPLADLELAHPGFVLVPPENSGTALALPEQVSSHIGVPNIDLNKGLNLFANGNVYGTPAQLLDKLGIPSKGLPITATLDPSLLSTVDGGDASVTLSAKIPLAALPARLGFINLPSNVRSSFFITLSPKSARSGVAIEGVIAVKLNNQKVDFDSTIALELDEQGGIAADVQGKSLKPWRNVMGINGLSLDTGSRIEVKTTVSSGQTLTFAGKTHIGSREADVTGSANILAGVVDKGAFEVKLDKLTLTDFVTLFNDAVLAGGGQPVKADLPDAKLTNVDIAFASPGLNVPEIGLPDGGIRLAGDLWFLMKDKPLTRVNAEIIKSNRLVMSGDISDFTLGPLALKGNILDIKAQTIPPMPPRFKVRGSAAIMGKKDVSVEIDAALEDTAVVSSLDLGGLLNFDLNASFATPVTGLNAGALAAQDMALNATLKSDIGAWLRGEGQKVVAKVFDSVGSDIKKLAKDFDTAKKKVDSLNGELQKARKRANAGAKTVDEQIAQAQKKVADAAGRVKSLKHEIDLQKDDIHGCNYSIKICYWWNWKGHCSKHKDVPDVARDAKCIVNNGRHAATIVAYEAALKTAQAAMAAADTVLAGLKKGEKGVDIASLDPEVIALEAALITANIALDGAEKLAQGAELGVGQLESGLKALERFDTFALTGSSLNGSYKKAVAGKPVVLGLEFVTAGKPQHLRLAFSLTDSEYNATQLDTLALLVAKNAVEALPGAAPAVTHLLNNAFNTRYDKANVEVDKAAKDNGLE